MNDPAAPATGAQQQHVYAYTITNVTRLLRNYTGPGLRSSGSSQDDSSHSSEAARSGEEISSMRHFAATTATSAGIETVGPRAEAASAGAPVEGEATPPTVTSSSQSQSRSSSSITSSASSVKPAIIARRWNHTKASSEWRGNNNNSRKPIIALVNTRSGAQAGKRRKTLMDNSDGKWITATTPVGVGLVNDDLSLLNNNNKSDYSVNVSGGGEQQVTVINRNDSGSSRMSNNKTRSDRPFGLSVDLEPSEIQSMYRSNATKATAGGGVNVTTSGAERSPEARARNLGDQAVKDKDDDVLPIMQLYNTSEIFNGSEVDEGSTRLTEVTTAESSKANVTVGGGGGQQEGGGRVKTVAAEREHQATTTKSTTVTRLLEGGAKESNDTTTKSSSRKRPPPPPIIIHHVAPSTLREINYSGLPLELNASFFHPSLLAGVTTPRDTLNISQVVSKRHEGDHIASQETIAIVTYILATLLVFPIALGVGLILRRLIFKNRKVGAALFVQNCVLENFLLPLI